VGPRLLHFELVRQLQPVHVAIAGEHVPLRAQGCQDVVNGAQRDLDRGDLGGGCHLLPPDGSPALNEAAFSPHLLLRLSRHVQELYGATVQLRVWWTTG